MHVQFLAGEDSLEEGMATRSSIIAWRIPRTLPHLCIAPPSSPPRW